MSSKAAPAAKRSASASKANPARATSSSPKSGSSNARALSPEQTQSFEQYVERIALRFSLSAAAIGLLVVVILNWNRNPVPMQADRTSFGSLAFYVTPLTVAVFGAIAYALGLREFNTRVQPQYRRRWESGGIVVGIGMGLVAGFVVAVGLDLAAQMFVGLELTLLQGALITGGIVGTLTQMFIKYAMNYSTGRALQLTILALTVGLYATASRMNNPEWWRIAFSHLGSMASYVWYLFTISLVLSAALMLVWLAYVNRDVRVLVAHKRASAFAGTYFNGGILWLAIGLALVGLFPTQLGVISHWIHNLAAYSLALLFGLWFIGLSRALPHLPPEIKTLSVTVAVVLVVTLIFAAFGRFGTVALQLICFGIGITWLQEVVRFVSLEAERLEPDLNAV